MTGHLFAAQADLTRLACDALVISSDRGLNISGYWADLLPPDLAGGDDADLLRLPEDLLDDGLIRLPQADGAPLVRPVVAIRGGGEDTAERVVAAMADGVHRVAEEVTRSEGRSVPLLGVHLAGTGEGGLAGRRGQVIDLFLPALREAAAETGVDVVLSLRDPSDVTAVQVRRSDPDWEALDGRLRKVADDLGERAARGELSLFLGAGVSRSVGVPGWKALVAGLAEGAGVDVEIRDDNLPELAAALATILGTERYHALMRDIVSTDRYGLGHGLLAGLRVAQCVTTNFDPCFERALEFVHGSDGFRVLPRSLADGGLPWLLKLHGDIEQPHSLVFTSEDFRLHPTEYRALHGVVQSLMLTSHLLFVGFSLTDQNFLDMAEAVAKVRREAEDWGSHDEQAAGTALALTGRSIVDDRLRDDLTFHTMLSDGDSAEAARMLEIFLDRMAWRAALAGTTEASYLLDERYDGGLTDADAALKEGLLRLATELPEEATSSAAWPRVEQVLTALGWRRRQTE